MKSNKRRPTSKKIFPVWGWIVLTILFLAITAAFVLQNSQPSAASLPDEVTVDEAANMRDQGAFILDVREPDEWAQFHIPDATLIPLGDLPTRLNELPNDQEIVVVCRSGNRSAQGRDILLNARFTLVTSMAGGMNQWQAQGLPIVPQQ